MNDNFFQEDLYSVEKQALALLKVNLWAKFWVATPFHLQNWTSALAAAYSVWEKVQNTFTIRLCVTLFCMWPFSPIHDVWVTTIGRRRRAALLAYEL